MTSSKSELSRSDSCLGRCCEQFHLSGYNEEIRQSDLLSEAWGGEKHTVAVMLRPLFEVHYYNKGRASSEQFYTCRHFDKVSRLCTNYENRPDMCRRYPDYGKCHHCIGCSHQGGKL